MERGTKLSQVLGYHTQHSHSGQCRMCFNPGTTMVPWGEQSVLTITGRRKSLQKKKTHWGANGVLGFFLLFFVAGE